MEAPIFLRRGKKEKQTICRMRVSDVALIPVQWVTVPGPTSSVPVRLMFPGPLLSVIVTSNVILTFFLVAPTVRWQECLDNNLFFRKLILYKFINNFLKKNKHIFKFAD
jgi:hypothetical protein